LFELLLRQLGLLQLLERLDLGRTQDRLRLYDGLRRDQGTGASAAATSRTTTAATVGWATATSRGRRRRSRRENLQELRRLRLGERRVTVTQALLELAQDVALRLRFLELLVLSERLLAEHRLEARVEFGLR
jgi:hypothetical protein